MPDRDFNAKDGGFTRIMNELIDKLIEYGLDRNESKLVWLVVRRTWSIRGQAWSVIKWDYMLKKTKLSSSSLSFARSKLIARNILHTKPGKEKKALLYKINSKVSTWVPEDKLPKIWDSHSMRLVQHVEQKKEGDLVQPVELSKFNTLNQLVQHVEPVPIKRKILKKESLKTNKGSVCDPPKIIELLTPKEQTEEDAKLVINCLNELSGKKFSHEEENLSPIIDRLENGASVEDCFKVCFTKWSDHTFQNHFYRPSTLFKKTLFEGYLNSTGTKYKPASKADARRYKNAELMYRRQHEREKARQSESRGEDST